MNVSAVTQEASISHQPLPFKGTPIVNFSHHFLIVIHHNITDRRYDNWLFLQTVQDSFNIIYFCLYFLLYIFKSDSGCFMNTFQLSLISLLIFCSLSMKAACQGTMTLEESYLDTICAALTLHACLRRTTTTSMLSTQECIYTTHSHLQYI